MCSKITAKQEAYLVNLINQATGNCYKGLSQVKEDGIGKKARKVRGISKEEATDLITEWKQRAK